MLFQLPVDTNLDNPLNQSILAKQVLVYINISSSSNVMMGFHQQLK